MTFRSYNIAAGRRRAELTEFFSWLLGASGQPEGHERAFRKRVSWCWHLQPRITPDGRPHPVLEADGTYVQGHCLLIVCDGMTGRVLSWRWCLRENSTDYELLFDSITHAYGVPRFLVADGMKGIFTAARRAWPGARLQRCLEHVRRDCRRDITLRPRTEAGKELKQIANMLASTRDVKSATLFLQAFNAWCLRWKGFLDERSPIMGDDLSTVLGWEYTHYRLRRCATRLGKLIREGELFQFLNPDLKDLAPLPCTSNRLEGGINSPIKRMILNHRGMPVEHMMRACEWMCWKRSGTPLPPIDSMRLPQPRLSGDDSSTDVPGWGSQPEWNELHTPTRYPNAID